MRQGEALENFLHTFDLGQTIIGEAPVGQRNFQERREDVGFLRIFVEIGGQKRTHEHILGNGTVTDRETRFGVNIARIVGVVLRIAISQLLANRTEILEQIVMVLEERS